MTLDSVNSSLLIQVSSHKVNTMASSVDLKTLIEHMISGSLQKNICRFCLQPLNNSSVDIFTTFHKEGIEFCIADVLKKVFFKQFDENENWKICSDCFNNAITTYKFFLLMQRSDEILNTYITLLNNSLTYINLKEVEVNEQVGISLPKINTNIDDVVFNLKLSDGKDVTLNTKFCDISFDSDSRENTECHRNDGISNSIENINIVKSNVQHKGNINVVLIDVNKSKKKAVKNVLDMKNKKLDSDNDVLLMMNKIERPHNVNNGINKSNIKAKLNSIDINYRHCSRCPMKYKFMTKLKEHMKNEHDVEMFLCRVCKVYTEERDAYVAHMRTEHDVYACPKCIYSFKRKVSLDTHMEKHKQMDAISSDMLHACGICGRFEPTEEMLQDHCNRFHNKKYACYYCGETFKGKFNYDFHIRRHEEDLMENNVTSNESNTDNKGDSSCSLCKLSFVDERSLLWHMRRLHGDELLFKYKIGDKMRKRRFSVAESSESSHSSTDD